MIQNKIKRTRKDWAELGLEILTASAKPPMDQGSLIEITMLAAGAFAIQGPSGLMSMIAVVYEVGRRDATAEAGKVIANVDEKLEKIT